MAPVQLQVTVEAASGLQKQRGGVLASRPSPYVVINIVGKEDLRLQTPVVKHSLAPVWNFSVGIDSFDIGETVQFILMDANTWPRSDKLLGRAFLTRQDIDSNECTLDLTLAESTANATLRVNVATVGDIEACEQTAMKGSAQLEVEETHEPVAEQSGEAIGRGSVLDSGGSTELSCTNCLVEVVENGEEGDNKSSITCLSPESTGSTEVPSPLLVSPQSLLPCPKQVFGAGDQTQPVPASCFAPPIIFMRTVHEPITVSAEEFARVLAGKTAMDSMEHSSIDAGSGLDQQQLPVTSQLPLTKPTQQVKLKKKLFGCC
mmetsp:Transcript_2385/g.4535  ORF Transcript_2385/g.4535 Transcript_2385/m.4535 type:complete len:318 (-) Transcript_2385:125-1078(-)